jgi:hypothetical protein
VSRPDRSNAGRLLGTRIEVVANADGDHEAVLVDGVMSDGSVFVSRSLDPQHPAVWLDGRRLYGVDFYWNGVYQFSVDEHIPSDRPSPEGAGADRTG